MLDAEVTWNPAGQDSGRGGDRMVAGRCIWGEMGCLKRTVAMNSNDSGVAGVAMRFKGVSGGRVITVDTG